MKKTSVLIAILLFGISAVAQDFTVNTTKSELKWTAKKVTGEHWGFITFKDGSLNIKADKIVSGKFSIDMSSIVCKDLEDAEWNGKLVGHLKSDDFFSVEKFPLSTLTITKSSPFVNDKANVKADLTIKGITNPVEFIVEKNDGAYLGTIPIDRTKYDVRYGSGKFFENLGNNMIYDEFTIDVKLFLNK